MHNLCSYDVHHIMSAVNPRHGDMSVTPNTDEKFTSIKIREVTFIDSSQFMPSSSDSLSKNPADDQYQEMMCYCKSDFGGNI